MLNRSPNLCCSDLESQKFHLGVCQRAIQRSILGVKRAEKIRNATLRSKTGIVDVGNKAAKLKWVTSAACTVSAGLHMWVLKDGPPMSA